MVWITTIIILSVILVIIVSLYFVYRKKVDEFNLKMNNETQIFDSSLGPIQFASKGEGIPVLILHGRLGGYDQGTSIIPFLSGIRGICPSSFGYLKTVLPEHPSFTDYADACIQLLNHLGIDKFGIIAISAGGPAALHIAQKEPDRCFGICMLSGMTQKLPALPDSQKRSFKAGAKSGFPYWLLSPLFADLLITASGVKKTEMKLLREDNLALSICRQSVKGFPICYRCHGVLSETEISSTMEPIPVQTIKSPALIIHGDADIIVPFTQAKRLSSSLSTAELMTIPGGSHFCAFSHRKEVFVKLINLLLPNTTITKYTHNWSVCCIFKFFKQLR
jgi:pimeloyl-ACP methyl ester carboxylesterase